MRCRAIEETWIYDYSPRSHRQSVEWVAPGKNRPTRSRRQKSFGKFMASVFWGTHGIILVDNLEKEQRINSEYYVAL